MTAPATIRLSTPEDAAVLAALDGEAWRYAYRGIIPGLSLERMIARSGTAWWERRRDLGGRTLLLEFDQRIVGYVTFGACRMPGARRSGEIHELYVRPECQGVGFGRRLFAEARIQLRARRLAGLWIWALADNELACRFYAALGGREHMRAYERFGDVSVEKIAFVWEDAGTRHCRAR